MENNIANWLDNYVAENPNADTLEILTAFAKRNIFVATIAYDMDGLISHDGGAFTTQENAMAWLKEKGQEFIADQLDGDIDRTENYTKNSVSISGRCDLFSFNGGVYESRLDDPEGVILEKLLANRKILNDC